MRQVAAGVVTVAIFALVALAIAVAIAVNTVQQDECTQAFHECASMAEGLAGTIDCRIEVYHCRTRGHFEFPDGTVREMPRASANGGQD